MSRKPRRKNQPPPPLSTYRPRFDRAILVLAFLGVLVTVHLYIQQGRGFDQGCWGFNPPTAAEAQTFNCEAVVTSDAGSILGISNVYWGMLYYLALVALSLWVARAQPPRLRSLKLVRAGLIGAGFLYSMYLVYYQTNQIGEYCALCLTSAALATLLFLIQLVAYVSPPVPDQSAAMSSTGFRDARLAGTLAVLALFLIGADFVYFSTLEVREAEPTPALQAATPQTPAASASATPEQCYWDDRLTPVEDYGSMVGFGDAMKGTRGAPVTVIEFFDPNCGHCAALHPVLQRVAAANGDKAAFYFKPYPIRTYPLWYQQIEALHAAHQEGKFFEMMEGQFARQGLLRETGGQGMPTDALKALAEEIGMDADQMMQRIQRGLYRGQIQLDRQAGQRTGMRGVPTVLINGRAVASRSEACFNQMIDEAYAAASDTGSDESGE